MRDFLVGYVGPSHGRGDPLDYVRHQRERVARGKAVVRRDAILEGRAAGESGRPVGFFDLRMPREFKALWLGAYFAAQRAADRHRWKVVAIRSRRA